MNGNKELYAKWCETTYVPIYSKPWWMDAVCGEKNWDVWLCEGDGEIYAAMPYYLEQRGAYHYITKAPLTQNNGIIFKHLEDEHKSATWCARNEKIIEKACDFIEDLGLDVYEQQYHWRGFDWICFSWRGFSLIPRVTFVIEDTSDYAKVCSNFTNGRRRKIKKGLRNICQIIEPDKKTFYEEHKKIFEKQGMECPFSFELWDRLYTAAKKENSSKILAALDENGQILSLAFFVMDEQSVYFLLGGNMPAFSSMDTYSALMNEGIRYACKNKLRFDFEGSMMKKVNHTYREFGGVPKTYYRIRKIFNKEIMKNEFEASMRRMEE